jgi:superfamily I DNA/RNA helicase
MKVLQSVAPTDEQLTIISTIQPRVEVIRGAAGSGKTTTAILRLRGLLGNFLNQRRRRRSEAPVRALVLTFNRTLRGYIDELVRHQAHSGGALIEVETFGRWANNLCGRRHLLSDRHRREHITSLRGQLPVDVDFLLSEVEYITGRFLPNQWQDYLDVRRTGRGATPRVERPLRQQILDDVIRPYADWKRVTGEWDWSDMEVHVAQSHMCEPYDIIVADETQDFSANQIRGILNHRADPSAVTLILDAAQRIYARGFTWREVGINLTPATSYRLTQNYRNTREIAALALPLVDGIMNTDTDATIPDLAACARSGPLPKLLLGGFAGQIPHAVCEIGDNIDLERDSVAFLQPRGGKWFDATRTSLTAANLAFVELTRETDWPQGPENIALSTIHSAKGLEFDHIFLLRLNREILPHGVGEEDDNFLKLRRLLAMGICRARQTVTLGSKPSDRSDLVDLLAPGTYQEVRV